MFSDLVFRLRALFRRGAVEGELDEELRVHFERHVEKLVASGLDREEALRQARLEFGGIDQVKEECRDARGVNLIETVLQDLRYGVRMLRKNPGFTITAVLTLGLGIGANTAIFSVVNEVLLKPLPYREPDRLTVVWEQNPERGWYRNIVSAANFLDWRKQNRVFTGMAAADVEETYTLTGTGKPEEVGGQRATANLFSLLGVRPLLGRTFLPEEDKPGSARVVVLSYSFWQRRYGGSRSVLGRQISLNNQSYTVIGVMPAGFYFPPFWQELFKVELWTAGLDLSQPDRTWHALLAVARLKPGVGFPQAQANMDAIARNIVRQYPDDKGWNVGLASFHEQAVGQTRPALLVLLGAVAFVLLIACVNVANLMLARATTRQREIAVRMVIGAGQARLIRQFFTESLVLAAMGGALGVLLTTWGVQLLPALAPKGALGLEGARLVKTSLINGPVLAFTCAVALATGVVFGLVPALAASKPDLNHALKESGRSSTEGLRGHRLRGVLVAGELALAIILVTGAGLMIKTMVQLSRVNLGFNPQNVLTMRIALLGSRYRDPAPQVAFFRLLTERVESLPGVEAASPSRGLPIEGWSGQDFVTEDDPHPGPNETPDANYLAVGPDYFRVMQIPLLQGRVFTGHDAQNSTRVAIVNEKLASTSWPGQNPIGKRLRMGGSEWPWMTVVGVAGNVKTNWPDPDAGREIYVPYTQYPWVQSPRHFIVRTALNPTNIAAAIRRDVSALDKDQPVSDIRMLTDVVGEASAQQRFSMVLLGLFASVALVLAAVGIYGVISYGVAQRIHEIGIRVALGAERHQVLTLVVGQAGVLIAAGVAAGMAGALLLTRFLGKLLYGVKPDDPSTFAAVALTLSVVALFASYIPARQAAKIDPMVALRCE